MFDRNAIIILLEKKGWSRYKLCKTANMAQSTLSDILSGKNSNPRMDTIQKIADALDVSVDTFFTQTKKDDDEKKISLPDDSDIIRIERARKKMPEKEKEKMMKVLEAAFEKYFDD